MSDEAKKALAINGGEPVRTDPWPARHLFGEEEKQVAVAMFDACIETGGAFGYNGEEEEAYCREFAEYLGGGYVDAVNSGTNAVYIALRALDLEPFTEVIVPPVTDPGGVMPVPLMNCIPIPADSVPGGYNIGPEQIEARITERTSAIIVAHIGGLPADMDPIMELARGNGIKVVEDCAQAHGATYKGRLVGTMGDTAAFSTMSGKHHASAAQGGLVFTKNEDMYWRARQASDRGKPFGVEGANGNVTCGFNMNLNDLSAAVGRVQLRKLPSIIAGCRRAARMVADRCASLKAITPNMGLPETEGAFWFLTFRMDPSKLDVDIDALAHAVRGEGVPCSARYTTAFTTQDWFKNRAVFGKSGYPWACPLYKGDPGQEYPLPNRDKNDNEMFMIKVHEKVTDREADHIAAALQKVETAYLK